MKETASQINSRGGNSASEQTKPVEATSGSQQHFESLLQSIDGIIWECDAETFRFTFVSQQAERILGYPVEQWLREPSFWADHLHPDDRPWAVDYCVDATTRRADHRLEYRMMAADGRAVWLSDVVKIHVTDEGQTRLRGVMVDITERKRTEEALRLSEEKFAKAFHASTVAFGITRLADGKIIEVNEAAAKFNGYSRAEMVGRTMGELGIWVNPDDRQSLVEELRRSGSVRDREYRFRTKQGKMVVGHYSGELIEVDGEQCLVSVLADITERRYAEEALKANEALLREFIKHTPAAIAMFDTEMRYIQTSDRWLTDYHLEGQNIIGKSHYDVFPDIPGRWKQVHARVLTGTVEKCDEDSHQLADGTLEWLQWEAIPWRKAGGEIGGMILFTQVISERKRAEEELRRVSERLQLATRAASISIWDWDVVKDKLIWDDAMYDLFSVRREDFSGTYDAWADCLAPEDFERATAEVQAALRGEQEFDTEFRIVWPDGSIHYLKGDAQTFRDSDGRPLRMVGINYDITERKLAEERISLLQMIMVDVTAAHDLSSALKVVLRHVCEKTGWALGQAWVPQKDGAALECCLAWFADDPDLKGFGDYSKEIPLSPGVGLPGRAWASREPLWIHDVTEDKNFPRFEFAKKSGLKSALGVPILSGDEVIAVLEFYLRETREEDERLVKLISAVAAQIGLVCARKLAEDKLRWSEERLRLILDSAAEGIFGVDLEGRCTFCNAASLRLLGYDRPADLLGREMHTLIAAKHADGTPYPMEECPAVRSLQNAKGAFSDEDVFWRKDSTCFPVEYWTHPMFRAGEHVGAVLTFLDITERKQAEESLRLSEERFAKAFHASPEPITIFSHRDGTLLEVNERWQEVYGYTREEAVGHKSYELNVFNLEDRERLHGLLEKKHSVREFEIDLKTKQGEIRHVSLSAEQIVINDELCNIFLHRDITERKQAEETAKESEERLRLVFEAAKIGTGEMDIQANLISLSNPMQRVVGY